MLKGHARELSLTFQILGTGGTLWGDLGRGLRTCLTNALHAASDLCADAQELAEVPARNLHHTVIQAGLKGCCSPCHRVPGAIRWGCQKDSGGEIPAEPPDSSLHPHTSRPMSFSYSPSLKVFFTSLISPQPLYLSSGRGIPNASLAAT